MALSCPAPLLHAMVDIGANLTAPQFRKDLGTVLSRAWSAGVHHILVTGTTLQESTEAVRLCREWAGRPDTPRIYCTIGCHPHYAAEMAPIDDFRRLIDANRDVVVAVGECGLDYERNLSPPSTQRDAFDAQLRLSADVNLPVFMHARGDCFSDLCAALDRHRRTGPGVLHCYTDADLGHLQRLTGEYGLHIGVTGWVCDERDGRGSDLAAVVQHVPLDRLLIETDCPYLIPRNIPRGALRPRPKFNEPALLRYVAEKLAVCYGDGMTADEIARRSTDNAVALFRLSV